MRTKIKRWGNSLAVRIPKLLADKAGLRVNSSVEISVFEGQIVIVPTAKKAYTLAELLANFSEDQRHEVVDLGDAQGNEVW
jgi:antitoxin MazE